MSLSKADAAIFDRWINKIGEYGGIVPAKLASKLMAGARLVIRFLPTETCRETIVRKIAPEQALQLGTAILSKLGELVPNDDIEPSQRVLKAVIGCGFLDMSPAIVRLEICDGDPGECAFRISAAAKEGLIKQDTAPKAVQRVASELLKAICLYQ